MSQYLEFRELDNGGRKTKVIGVFSQRSGEQLATIRWYGPWRCYTLQPMPSTIWNEQCLMDVNSYINRLKAERSEQQRAARVKA